MKDTIESEKSTKEIPGGEPGPWQYRLPLLVPTLVAGSLLVMVLLSYFQVDRAWDSLPPARQQEAIDELIRHYEPIVEAVHAFE